MANQSRTRTSIITLQTWLQGLITAAQPTWDVRIFPTADVDQITKVYPDLRTDIGACVITYLGAPKWGTFTDPSPVRKMSFRMVLMYNVYAVPSTAVNYIQTMIESLIDAVDCQIYNTQATIYVSRDSMEQPIDKGSGLTTAMVDFAIDDVSG